MKCHVLIYLPTYLGNQIGLFLVALALGLECTRMCIQISFSAFLLFFLVQEAIEVKFTSASLNQTRKEKEIHSLHRLLLAEIDDRLACILSCREPLM